MSRRVGSARAAKTRDSVSADIALRFNYSV